MSGRERRPKIQDTERGGAASGVEKTFESRSHSPPSPMPTINCGLKAMRLTTSHWSISVEPLPHAGPVYAPGPSGGPVPVLAQITVVKGDRSYTKQVLWRPHESCMTWRDN